MKNGFVNKNKFLEDFGRFFFCIFIISFLFIIRVLFVMEVSVDVEYEYEKEW